MATTDLQDIINYNIQEGHFEVIDHPNLELYRCRCLEGWRRDRGILRSSVRGHIVSQRHREYIGFHQPRMIWNTPMSTVLPSSLPILHRENSPPPPLEEILSDSDEPHVVHRLGRFNFISPNIRETIETLQNANFLSNPFQSDRFRQKDTEYMRKMSPERYQTIFNEAVAMGDLELMDMMVHKGVDINEPIHGNMTPLIVAVRRDLYDTVLFLLELNVDVTTKDRYHQKSALTYAMEKENRQIRDLLLKHDPTILVENRECEICTNDGEFFRQCNECKHAICIGCQSKLNRDRCPFCRTDY